MHIHIQAFDGIEHGTHLAYFWLFGTPVGKSLQSSKILGFMNSTLFS